MKLPTILPDAFLRCIEPSERKKIAVGQLTAEEALSKAEIRNEKELQRNLVNLLRLHNIEPIVSRMDRKTSNNLGTPDILFSIAHWIEVDANCQKCGHEQYLGELAVVAVAYEVKFGNGKLSPEQEKMFIRLSSPPNNWRCKVIRSVDEMIADLKELGIKKGDTEGYEK